MRVAHLILAHQQPQQLARLSARLAAAGDPVLIHLDAKVDAAPFRAALPAAASLIGGRVPCEWGTYSLVEATLRLIRAGLADPGATHLALLSGADYPLRPLTELHQHLAATPEREYLQVDDRAAAVPAMRSRYERYWLGGLRRGPARKFQDLLQLWPVKRRFPGGLAPWSGSQWWVLTRACAAWAADRLERDRQLQRFLRHVFIPDEFTFATLIMASPFRGRVARRNLHRVDFAPDEPHPRVWRAADLERLRASGAFFGRKFDPEVDADILDRLDAVLGAR